MEWLKKLRRRWHNDIFQWNEDLKNELVCNFRQALPLPPPPRTTIPCESESHPKFQLIGVGPDFQYGRNTYFGSPCRIFHPDTEIGAFCSISWDVNIGTTHHPTDWLSTHIFTYSCRPDLYDIVVPGQNLKQFSYVKPVKIGNDVWVGCNVTIMDGVHIEDGAIIGAGSVVTKDVPPYAIVAGSPARVIRYRFDKQTIEELKRLKWWELEDSIIASLPFDNIFACIKILKKHRSIEDQI